jgi:putative DNA primase/helicase
MSGRDWQAFDAELRARTPEIAAELLGNPTFRAGQEWRWGRKGSLSVVIGGARAGMWFDHEAGQGGGFVDLIARELRSNRRGACAWAAERTGLAPRGLPAAGPARRAAKPMCFGVQ